MWNQFVTGRLPSSNDSVAAIDLPRVVFCRICCAATVAASVGCNSGPSAPQGIGDMERLRGIATVYAEAARSLGRPPTEVSQLKNMLAVAMDNVDEVFQSTRDGEEYVIVWGIDVLGADKNSDTILAYERRGVDGKRWVVNCRGESLEVSDTEFANLRFPKGHQPEVG